MNVNGGRAMTSDLKEERKYGRLYVCVFPTKFVVDEVLQSQC